MFVGFAWELKQQRLAYGLMVQPRSWGGQPAPALSFLGELAQSESSRVDLCRILDGHHAGQLVALKRLHSDWVANETVANAFRDEIWMVSSLKHKYIARVVSWGEDSDGPFLATEFVYGVSLLRLMRTVVFTGDGFGERFVVYVAGCVAHALAAAHGLVSATGQPLELVHRDLTPANILVGVKGEVKLTDFGLAKANQRITQTIVGRRRTNHAYMAPEQSMAMPVDGRADIFSLGVLMFELFANRHPWVPASGTPDSEGDIVNRMLSHEPTSLAELCPRIDKRLVALVDKCIARDPEDRYRSAEELAVELDEWLLAHGYVDNGAAMGRIVRRHALKQLRQIDRLLAQSEDSPSVEEAGASAWSEGRGGTPASERGETMTSESDRDRQPSTEATRSDALRTVSLSGPLPAGSNQEDLVTTRLAARPQLPASVMEAAGIEPVGVVALPDPAVPPVPYRAPGRGQAHQYESEAPASSHSGPRDLNAVQVAERVEKIVVEAKRVAAMAEHAGAKAQHSAEQAKADASVASAAAQKASQAARAAAWASQALAIYDSGDDEQARQLLEHALSILDSGFEA